MNTQIATTGRMEAPPGKGSSSLRVILVLGALLAGLCLWSVPAQGYVGINEFTMEPDGTQAGGHPDALISMSWDTAETEDGNSAPPITECACDDARIVTNHFPTGFIGNPHAAPACEIIEFSFGRCPASSQVGLTGGFGFGIPLYNVVPHPNEPALTAFWFPLVASPVFIRLAPRTESDYGLDSETSPIFHPLAITGTQVHLWGVPGDPIHDVERFIPPLQGFGICGGALGGGESFQECAAWSPTT